MLQNALKALRGFLPNNQSVTLTEIETQVDFILTNPMFRAVNREQLIKEAELFYNIRIEEFKIIESDERKMPWIANKKAIIEWGFWNRYRDYLEVEKSFSPNVLNELDRLTDKILDGTFDPTAKIQVGKRGLVVGQVQSGKTSNYTGLICKAADAGFKLIIVLAGIHNNLRSQTQLRLDEGFLGFDTQHQRVFSLSSNKFVGVGAIRTNRNHIAHSITSSLDKGDFSTSAFNSLGINFDTNEVIIAVVKKNSVILKNIYNWLSSKTQDLGGKQLIRDKALLLIDDEADNASINTSKNSVSAINKHIRNILNLFEKNAYVGYTATPFANVFIPVEEQKDIFPRDFIINLAAPSNYIGPEKVFGFSPLEDNQTTDFVLPMVYKIDDGQSLMFDKNSSPTEKITTLPNSLQLAIKTFMLTCAIRYLRGQEKEHNSMLIHVSRYNAWQDHIFDLVQNAFDIYRRGIEMNDTATYEAFRQVFEGTTTPHYKNFVQTSTEILHSPLANLDAQIQVHKWEDVKQILYRAISKIQVREINGGSKEALDYFEHKEGLSVIAVGGDKLSRGLTLEGLSVSYFLRASRMYDTLMQMGRWFGYRRGYVDLCRLFTTRELNEWFCHITEASEELRKEFDYMQNVAGTTPEKYALKVRTHPGLLQITASNKLRDVREILFSFSARLVETYEFVKDKNIFKHNFEHTHRFIEGLGKKDENADKNDFIWRNVKASTIINFLEGYQMAKDQPLRRAEPKFIINYISKLLGYNELTNWSVALINNSQPKHTHDYRINGIIQPIGLTVRNADDKCSSETHQTRKENGIYYLKKSHIISPDHEYIDLDKKMVKQAIEREKQKGKKSSLSGEIVRNELRSAKNPLLLLYSLSTKNGAVSTIGLEDMQDLDVPIIGFAISFPKSEQDDKITNIAYAIQDKLLPYFQQDAYDRNLTDDDNEND